MTLYHQYLSVLQIFLNSRLSLRLSLLKKSTPSTKPLKNTDS